MSLLTRILLGPLCLLLSLTVLPARAGDVGDAPTILHILGYIGVDYPAAVVNGKVRNQSEYAEQREFSARVRTLIDALPPSGEKESLRRKAVQLAAQIDARENGEIVSQQTESMRDLLVRTYGVQVAPRKPADLAQGARLYTQLCESCHGREGHGDGEAAKGMTPPPANFHNAARQSQRSVYALYNAISIGVAGTGMQGYAQTLKDDERWSLAFHVSNYLADDKARAAGAALWAQEEYRLHFA
ncbi:MAG: cytochrome c, partial [Gammaproteobacteria bacterium]|nr:cytochrome c [Gammaproteobacteria bacterium]